MWVNDIYHYAPGTLKAISASYHSLYTVGIELSVSRYRDILINDPLTVILFKADFDLSLSAIGKGHWTGVVNSDFSAYRYFGKAQQVVIADILGIRDNELAMLGFYHITQLRGRAYRWMTDFLNGFRTDE
ncbi:unnamed protein product [marine sediment metagenome]|uniref:Uncharacterized protein n=1 Tax=marine sediment metagenome TaxID=412755 RepID=X1EQ24_9ZZZZ